MKFGRAAALGFSVLLFSMMIGTEAEATEYLATYTGTVSGGTDGLGLFGVAGEDLTGKTFTAKYVYDPALGTLIDNGLAFWAHGGTAYGVSSPVLSVALTINGVTQTITLASPIVTGVLSDNPNFELAVSGTDGSAGSYDISTDIVSTALPLSLTTPFDVTATSEAGGSFAIYDSSDGSVGSFSTAELVVSKIVTPPGGAPEPGVWAMLLTGLGVSGFWLRLRTRDLVIA